MRFLRFVGGILNLATGTLFSLWRAHHRVKRSLDCLAKKDPKFLYSADSRTQLCENLLIQHLEQEHSRREVIEDKAKTSTLGITFAFSVMFAGVAVLSASATPKELCDGKIGWVSLVLIFGFFFQLIGGLLAFEACRITKYFVWTLEERAENDQSEFRAAKIIWYIELNQIVNRQKTNQISASNICIRNGVVLLAIASVLLALCMTP